MRDVYESLSSFPIQFSFALYFPLVLILFLLHHHLSSFSLSFSSFSFSSSSTPHPSPFFLLSSFFHLPPSFLPSFLTYFLLLLSSFLTQTSHFSSLFSIQNKFGSVKHYDNIFDEPINFRWANTSNAIFRIQSLV